MHTSETLYSQNFELAFAHKIDCFPNHLTGNNTFTDLVEQKVNVPLHNGKENKTKKRKIQGKKRRPCTNTSIFVSYQKRKWEKPL